MTSWVLCETSKLLCHIGHIAQDYGTKRSNRVRWHQEWLKKKSQKSRVSVLWLNRQAIIWNWMNLSQDQRSTLDFSTWGIGFHSKKIIILSFVINLFIWLCVLSIIHYFLHKLYRHDGGGAFIWQSLNWYCRSHWWSYTASWSCKQILTAIWWTRKWGSAKTCINYSTHYLMIRA